MIKNYAIIEGGIVVNTAVIDDENTEVLASFEVVEIPPNTPVSIGWRYDGSFTSAVRDITEQLAQETQRAADEAAKAAAKADAAIQYFITHTPAEINQFVKTQVNADGVTNLATSVAALKELETLVVKLAVVVSVVAKRDLR